MEGWSSNGLKIQTALLASCGTNTSHLPNGAFVGEGYFLPHKDALRFKRDNVVIKEVPNLKVLLTVLLAV